MDSPDLQIKYQKLASEYSKLRAQNQVLKKAVIDEQGKNTQLKENLKSRDQSLRKLEQEVDSVAFRNQQLTKRLSLLQDDLEILRNKPKKGQVKEDSHSTNSIVDKNVYAEELESKIQENARLHAELSEVEIYYKHRISELESQLEVASKEASKASENMKSQEQYFQSEIKRLENERVVQEVNIQQRESKIIELQTQMKIVKGSSEEETPNSTFSKGSSTIRDRRAINLPIGMEEKIGSPKKPPDGKVIMSLLEPIKSLSSGFTEFLLQYSSLLKQSLPMSSVQLKLAEQLGSERSSWDLLSQRYEEMAVGLYEDGPVRLEKLIGLDSFTKALASSASSLRKLLPILSEKWLCFHEGQLDAPWRSTLGRLVSCLAAINPYVASLAAHSDGRTVLTPSAIQKILNLLHERITKLHSTSQELVTAWELLNIEDKKTGDAIKKALSGIENSLNKISSVFFEKVLPSCCDVTSYTGSPSSGHSHSPGTPKLWSSSAASLLTSPDGCIYEGIQLPDNETSFAQQLAQATSRLSKLEEEREHWRLEFQLLNHRFEKETKKCEALMEELKYLRISSKTSESDSEVASMSAEDKRDSHTSSIVGEVIIGSCTSEEREKEIREHFTNRCSHLYMQLTSCLSQASLYQNECENLIRRLAISEESRLTAEQEVEKQRREKAEIQENLSTTSRNYEEQISTMSEHLADLNEKFANQADSIEQLKFELKKKGKK